MATSTMTPQAELIDLYSKMEKLACTPGVVAVAEYHELEARAHALYVKLNVKDEETKRRIIHALEDRVKAACKLLDEADDKLCKARTALEQAENEQIAARLEFDRQEAFVAHMHNVDCPNGVFDPNRQPEVPA